MSSTLNTGDGSSVGASVLVAVGRFLVSLFVPVMTFLVLWGGFLFLRDSGASQLVITLVAIVWGVGGVAALYWTAYWLVIHLPIHIQPKLEPYLFVGPALVALAWFLTIPVLRSGWLSFFDNDSTQFIGWDNFRFVFTNRSMVVAWRNNVIWLVVGTAVSVVFGFIIAIVADKSKWERIAKAAIFMPMAISMVGAGIIWRFVYAMDPNIGLLNAIVTTLGGHPQNWLILRPWNTFFLIAVFVWGQTGFAMIVLSAAIKGVPGELLEAAEMDGAGEFTQVTRIVLPYIKSTIITVSTAIIIATLKTFDVVFAMTQGLDGTEVLASQQYKQMFRYFNYGRGAAIAVIILLAVIPVVVYNVVQYKKRGDI